MPKPKQQSYSKDFVELKSVSESLNENRDCSVKAVALVGGIDYHQSQALLKKHGRKPGCGARFHTIQMAVEELGFFMRKIPARDIIKLYPKGHCDVLKSVTTYHPQRFPGAFDPAATYMIFTSGHVAVVKSGVTHDWSIGRALRARDIFIVEKKGI